jgi:DNA-binding NarL/FixJ family response regulator
MIRVFIVEDQLIVREGLSTLLALSPDVEIVGMSDCAETALAIIPSVGPGLLLLDIKLPGSSGVELIRQLRDLGCLPPTLILTTFEDENALIEGLRAGAKGYLLKDVSFEQLLAGIREVAGGGTHINPAVTERILRAAMKSGEVEQYSVEKSRVLTEREIEVLRLMAYGYSNREIARTLAVAEGTIKNHVSSILGKLEARDRTRAVLKGLQNGLF